MNNISFLKFEPKEPNALERGLITSGEKRQDAAASWFRRAIEACGEQWNGKER